MARSFLHACSPPIIHGNLTSDTIFIQHNGLIKIGSGAGRAGGGAGGPGSEEPAGTEGGGCLMPHHIDSALLSPLCPAQCGTASSPMVRGDPGGWRDMERSGPLIPALALALPDDLRSPIHTEQEEPRNLHFFPPEYGGESRRPRPQHSFRPACGADSPSLFQRWPTAPQWTSSPSACVRWRYWPHSLLTWPPPSSLHPSVLCCQSPGPDLLAPPPDGCAGDPGQRGHQGHGGGHRSCQALAE